METTAIKGILYLALVPTLVVVLTILSLRFSLLGVGYVSIVVVYTLGFYFILLVRPNSYSDSQVLEKVVIPSVPPKVEELLKKQTRNHELIYVILIKILGKRKKLSQSDFVKQLKSLGIEYSQPAVEDYLSELEDKEIGIVESEKGYRRVYSLTRRGEWCYKAVKVCFPKRFFYFIIRHYLGRRKLPSFPQ
jgi:predicted transcriptional regulator